MDWTGLDPTQKASPIRASSDANNVFFNSGKALPPPLIRAMPERKHFFFREVFPYLPVPSLTDSLTDITSGAPCDALEIVLNLSICNLYELMLMRGKTL